MRVLMVLFVYAPFGVFILLPLYIIGGLAAVIWTGLCIGYKLGEIYLNNFLDSFDKYK